MAAGALAQIKITLDNPASDGVVIPKFWQTSGGDYYMATLEQASIAAGQSEIIVNATQGRRYVSSFEGTGEKYQTFVVTQEKICRHAVTVAGETWDHVDTFVGQTADAKVYHARLLWDGGVEFSFGNDQEGAMPPDGTEIIITYIVTLGSESNIATGIINNPVDTVYDGDIDITDQVTVTNIEAATGGDDEESLDDIKRNGPRLYHTRHRMVAGNDHESLISAYPGVKRCYVRDLNSECGENCRYNYTEIYVAPSGGGELSEAFRAELVAFIEGSEDGRKLAPQDIRIFSANYVLVDLEIDAYRYADSDQNIVLDDITSIAQDWFDLDQNVGMTDWGTDIDADAIRGKLDKINGLSYANVTLSTTSVGVGEIAILNNLKINLRTV
jgi:hypothetical protein